MEDQKYGKVIDLYLRRYRKRYTEQSYNVVKQRLRHWPKIIGFSMNAKAVNLLSASRIEKGLKSLELNGANKNSVINYISAVLRLKRRMFPQLERGYAVDPSRWSRINKGSRSDIIKPDIPDFDLLVQVAKRNRTEKA